MNRYDDRARLVFHYAREEGNRLGHAMVGPEHLLLGLMREGGTAATILTEFGASLDGLRRRVEEIIGRGEGNRLNDAPSITPRARRVMELASSEARSLGAQVTSTEHILLGIIREGDGVAFRILQELTKDVDTIRWRILAQGESSGGKAAKPVATPFLDEYGRDLTKWAREGKLDPVIGRSEEIRRVTQILTRRTKNNPVLIGDPGVGKTAIVEGLALAIHEKRTPPNLHGIRLISLDLSGVVAGTKYRGEIDLVSLQIEKCKLTSPIDGTIVTPQLQLKEGLTLKMGDPICEVYDLTQWQLVLDVPQEEIGWVQRGLADDKGSLVEFYLAAYPEQKLKARINTIGQISEMPQIKENGNVYQIRMEVPGEELRPIVDGLRSGNIGRAKISTTEKPLGYVLLRKVIRFFRVTFF